MILRSAIAFSVLIVAIPCIALVKADTKRPTLQDAQQSCLKTAVRSGQDKASPMGVRQVCGLDVLSPTLSSESKALSGPTGNLSQPEVDEK